MNCRPVIHCQSCGGRELESVLWLGVLPLVNDYRPVDAAPAPQTNYPHELLRCRGCTLVQLGCVVEREALFPYEYPYTSGTTRALRENFTDLAVQASAMLRPGPEPLVVDVGSNDGTLLSCFKERGWRVQGITPEAVGRLAVERGIPTHLGYFDAASARAVIKRRGLATLVTATNVFAHVEDPHAFVEDAVAMLAPGGMFATESHYLGSLLEGNQFDAVYAEHMRYYSLESVAALLGAHGLVVVDYSLIPTHGGSIRVFAGRKGEHPAIELDEPLDCGREAFEQFAGEVAAAKHDFWSCMLEAGEVHGVGAPSRAGTLLSYFGATESSVPVVYEAPGSHKVGRYMPGSRIEVREEPARFDANDGPDTLLLLSWHIAAELMPKLRAKGFEGQFLVPLPEPRLVRE